MVYGDGCPGGRGGLGVGPGLMHGTWVGTGLEGKAASAASNSQVSRAGSFYAEARESRDPQRAGGERGIALSAEVAICACICVHIQYEPCVAVHWLASGSMTCTSCGLDRPPSPSPWSMPNGRVQRVTGLHSQSEHRRRSSMIGGALTGGGARENWLEDAMSTCNMSAPKCGCPIHAHDQSVICALAGCSRNRIVIIGTARRQ